MNAMMGVILRTRFWLWAVFFAGVLLFGFFGVVRPEIQKFIKMKTQLREVKFKVAATEKAGQDLKNLNDLLQKTREEMVRLDGMPKLGLPGMKF